MSFTLSTGCVCKMVGWAEEKGKVPGENPADASVALRSALKSARSIIPLRSASHTVKPCCEHYPGHLLLLLMYSKYRRYTLWQKRKLVKAINYTTFPWCNQPLHNLLSHQNPPFSTKLKSTIINVNIVKVASTAC